MVKISPIVLFQENNIRETIFQCFDEPSRIFIRQKYFILKILFQIIVHMTVLGIPLIIILALIYMKVCCPGNAHLQYPNWIWR